MLGSIAKSRDPNFPTGHDGLIAVDNVGNKVLFLDTRPPRFRLERFSFNSAYIQRYQRSCCIPSV